MTVVLGKAESPRTGGRATRWRVTLSPWLWISPAVVIVGALLVYPVFRTIWTSLFNEDSTQFVGLENYRRIFTNPITLEYLRNNVLWLVLGTAATVFFGLVIAVLADRARFERVTKAAIFIPMAISMVGA